MTLCDTCHHGCGGCTYIDSKCALDCLPEGCVAREVIIPDKTKPFKAWSVMWCKQYKVWKDRGSLYERK